MKATYVSVWDDGIEIGTPCEIDLHENRVEQIKDANVDGVNILVEEYVEIDGGNQIRSFYNADGDYYVTDGQRA